MSVNDVIIKSLTNALRYKLTRQTDDTRNVLYIYMYTCTYVATIYREVAIVYMNIKVYANQYSS